eukprot:1804800-Lingulodinium_polyedra.AAC.1
MPVGAREPLPRAAARGRRAVQAGAAEPPGASSGARLGLPGRRRPRGSARARRLPQRQQHAGLLAGRDRALWAQ